MTFIDKTEINRAEMRVQTVGKGSLLESTRMVKVRPGQSLTVNEITGDQAAA